MTSSNAEEQSFSKLMAGAMLMDGGECNDLLYNWPEGATTSTNGSAFVKAERSSEHFTPSATCLEPWSLQNQVPDFSTHSSYPYLPPNNGFFHAQVPNGRMNNLFGQNHDLDSLKPLHDQFRQKYGNYSNEKYPDFNVALKAEICDRKWKPCSFNSNTDLYENLSKSVNNSSSDEAYSQKSFKQNESKLTQLGIPNRQDDLPKPKLKSFDFGESDSDSKASNSGSGSRLEDWPPSSSPSTTPMDINIDEMVNSGVTIAGYKPRKIISKRKKSNIPSESKDYGYWEKRKKNNDSARRSREAKKEKERSFYKRALELEYENHYLKERVQFLERKIETLMHQNPNLSNGDSQTTSL